MKMYRSHSLEIEQQYDKISTEFDTSRKRIWTSVQDFILKHKRTCKTLLDVGVGNGKNILFAKNHNFECVGIDISNNLLDICRKKSLTVFKKDVLDLDNSFGTFDTILSIATIHHLENTEMQKKALLNMINCLNDNGHLLVSVWSFEIFNRDEKSDYRDFVIGPNIVEWNSVKGENKVERFYFIHDYHSFKKIFREISIITPITYEITWEKQNWFCEIKKCSDYDESIV